MLPLAAGIYSFSSLPPFNVSFPCVLMAFSAPFSTRSAHVFIALPAPF